MHIFGNNINIFKIPTHFRIGTVFEILMLIQVERAVESHPKMELTNKKGPQTLSN